MRKGEDHYIVQRHNGCIPVMSSFIKVFCCGNMRINNETTNTQIPVCLDNNTLL